MTKSRPDVGRSRQDALDALDDLLRSGHPGCRDKLAALRDVEAAAKRMADGIEQRLKLIP